MKKEALKIDKRLYLILMRRLEGQGGNNLWHFSHTSGIPFSHDVVRRCFGEHQKQVDVSSLAAVMLCLNYTHAEIKTLLRDYTNDDIMWRLIGPDTEGVTFDEQAMLYAYRKLVAKRPELRNNIAGQLKLLAGAVDVDIQSEVAALMRDE